MSRSTYRFIPTALSFLLSMIITSNSYADNRYESDANDEYTESSKGFEVKLLGFTMIKDGNNNQPITVFIDKTSNRAFVDDGSIDNNDKEVTTLYDMNESVIYTINHTEAMTFKMDFVPNYRKDSSFGTLGATSQNKGISVGGFSSKQYQVSVPNKNCLTVDLSSDLLAFEGIKDFFTLYGRIKKTETFNKEMRSAFKDKTDARHCIKAPEYVYKNLLDKGIPLRFEADGKTLLEIATIQDNQIGDKRMFIIPPDYDVMSMREEMRKEAEKMSKELKQKFQKKE